MFTGLVQSTGRWERLEATSGGHAKLWIRAVLDKPAVGESIAVNGVCLTLTDCTKGGLSFHALSETLNT